MRNSNLAVSFFEGRGTLKIILGTRTTGTVVGEPEAIRDGSNEFPHTHYEHIRQPTYSCVSPVQG